MSDVFEEVEEDLNRDKWVRRWEKYGWVVYLVGAMIVAAVAAYEFMKLQASNAQVKNIEIFESARSALSDGEYSDAETEFSNVVAQGSELAPLASHYLAQTRLEGGGDRAGAAEALAVNAASDDPFAKIAVLKSAYLAADTQSLAELETRLSTVLQDDGPVGALALELIAAKAFEEGDFARARSEFALLQVLPNAPPGVLARADAALSVIPSVPEAPIEPATETENSEEEAGQ